jgi:hypothetical protein
MTNIRSFDMMFLDDVFDMGGGYVLNFSDRTFAQLFAEELNIDIDVPLLCAERELQGQASALLPSDRRQTNGCPGAEGVMGISRGVAGAVRSGR